MDKVSNLVNHGIESKYFDIKYRPQGGLSTMDIMCSSLLTYLALADATRQEEQINNLMHHFCEVLSMCKEQKDYDGLTFFIGSAASVGGYAREFYQTVAPHINPNGKNFAFEYIKKADKKDKVDSDKINEFKERLTSLNESLSKLESSSSKDEDDVSYLIRKYNELDFDLFSFADNLDKEFVYKCSEQIDSAISYLKNLYRAFDEADEIMRGL